MSRKVVITVLVLLVVCIGVYYFYSSRIAARLDSGTVYSNDGSSTSDSDGRLAPGPTPSRSDAPGTINGTPVAGALSNQPPAPIRTQLAPSPTYSEAASVPANDTVSPNPPNGLAFGGTGVFQWYRQGNLTWRINTNSGSSCIAFATMDEWRKPIVYTHGCGNA